MQSPLVDRDLKHLWHPCAQMKDYESFPPIEIASAEGSYLELRNGQKLIDSISSWWCKSLGHRHPSLMEALKSQADAFDHVILANTTNEPIVELSEKLCSISPHLNKVFYGGDGSTAVEIALKMSVHAHRNQGNQQRTRFASLQNGYHGETSLCLGVSDCDLYKAPYADLAQQAFILKNPPLCAGPMDPKWTEPIDFTPWAEQLNPLAETLSAFIFEPILQGAGGMLITQPSFLKELERWCRSRGIHLIADEIMTGFGRTGTLLASQHAGIQPDFVCVAKGLNGGVLPFCAMLTTDEIYDSFYDSYESGKAFMHSNTYTGNALGVATSLATWDVLKGGVLERIQRLQEHMMTHLTTISNNTGRLKNLRGIGAMVAADLITEDHGEGRWGYAIYRDAVERGALLRPLGNTLYWLPPLNTGETTIDELATITQESISQVLGTR